MHELCDLFVALIQARVQLTAGRCDQEHTKPLQVHLGSHQIPDTAPSAEDLSFDKQISECLFGHPSTTDFPCMPAIWCGDGLVHSRRNVHEAKHSLSS